jgi:RimJ/RimL family protein N-acetyltransferase
MTALATQIVSEHLLLRAWQPRDRAAFAAMNADAVVMRYFPACMTEEESDAAATRYNQQLERDGFTMFAAEERETGQLAGVLGAQTMRFAIPGIAQPAVEIGWRLAQYAQGRGLATEGARAVLDYLRSTTALHEVFAITTPDNVPSQRVMLKLGMQPRPELTFDHPLVAADSPRRRHVLYSLELNR